MEILLDTTVQIERIFKRKRKEKIEEMISAYHCGTSTYVLGEFNNNIVKDFVALFNIMQMEKDLAGVRYNINDNVFNRDYQRIRYIFDDLCNLYNDNYELIKEQLYLYSKHLLRRFRYGLVPELINDTGCHRAEAIVKLENGAAVLENISCSQTDNFCEICDFWQRHNEEAKKILADSVVSLKVKEVLNKIFKCGQQPKGNRCRTLGDCIISLEALHTDRKQVCSTNVKDFKPICDCIGVDLYKIESCK